MEGYDAVSYLKGVRDGYKKRKDELEMATISLADMCLEHRKAGINDVVEWIKEHRAEWHNYDQVWQAKLREWEIK